jgi:DNA (cytosine-5)-methyltransferase 1
MDYNAFPPFHAISEASRMRPAECWRDARAGLVSGIGGFSLGLQRAGMQTAAFCEIEPYCRKVLAKHWPGVPIYEDIRTLTQQRLKHDGITPVDLVCGGFPCQDINAAGSRVGINGKRSGLWSEYPRLIDDLRPRWVVVENVDDLAVRGLGRVLGDLAKIGYDAEWHCIPAAAVGADHWRDRIWIIAYPHRPGSFPPDQLRRQQRPEEMGQDAPHHNGAGLSRGMQARTLREDASAVSPWLGLALCAQAPFPGLDGAGSPVLGRSENGIPDRVDRMHALGNAVVPQIPELIGRAILEYEKQA